MRHLPRQNNSSMSFLVTLPDDILLTIALQLSIPDILSLKQTCRVLHAFGGSDYLWHRLIEHFHFPLDIPQSATFNNVPADELQKQAIKALRLETNWRRPKSTIKRSTVVQDGIHESFVHMQFLPGGNYLLTVQRYHRLLMTRVTIRISVWSLTNIDHPIIIFTTELEGIIYRKSVIVDSDNAIAATLVIGIRDDRHDYIEIRSVPLVESTTSISPLASLSSYQSPSVRQVLLPAHPQVVGDRVIEHIFVAEGTMAVTVAICEPRHLIELHILLGNVHSGPLRWVDPKFTQNLGSLQVRIQQGRIFFLGQIGNTTVVRVYKQPSLADGQSTTEFIDLGSPVATYEQNLPLGLQYSSTENLHVPQRFSDTIPIFMFNVQDVRSRGHRSRSTGYVVYFKYSKVNCVSIQGDIEGAIHNACIPCTDESSQQLIQLGTTGYRMVWIEHEMETGRNKVMKFEGRVQEVKQPVIQYGLLLPPQPDLPFSLNACNSLAFDEVTGRVCLAFYEGSLHVLDFVD
ncbi:hypothetical protein C8Q75DRAFT_782887 [Abortiporus biennis]|nr:hypothetical protein C8Q75DRAFT_782887 [Abortiporus biennis]